jgi:hypothetical protein
MLVSLRGLISICDLRDVGYGEDDVVDSVDGAVIYMVSERIIYRISGIPTSRIRINLPMFLYRLAVEEDGEDDRDIATHARYSADLDELLLHETQSAMVSISSGGL